MNKYDKLQIALILQDLESLRTGNFSNNISSTVGNLVTNIEKDGFDQQDVAKLMLDQSFDRNPQGVIQKIQNNVGLHYDNIKKEFEDRNDNYGLMALESMSTSNPDWETLESSLYGLLKTWSKHADGGEIDNSDEVIMVNISGKSYRLIVAKSEEDKEHGLMNVEELDSDEGMFFDYRDDVQDEISFWMKDTFIPLDIIFVDSNNIVLSVQKGEPKSERAMVEHNVAYVIEVNQNSGVKAGDVVKFKTPDKQSSESELQILGSDGEVQAVLQGGERIFSIKNTKTLVSLAKRAYESQSDSDYKALGKKIFEYMDIQDNRDPEYVEN